LYLIAFAFAAARVSHFARYKEKLGDNVHQSSKRKQGRVESVSTLIYDFFVLRRLLHVAKDFKIRCKFIIEPLV
jgi:hypothetical protein